MAQGQKEAVVFLVKQALPGFVPFKDVALVHLSASQLEAIKAEVLSGIRAGLIEYGKDPTNNSEVIPYARSMVMNHLKKAKELNGNNALRANTAMVQSIKQPKVTSKIQMDLLPDDLKEFVNTLV
jgi:hypothetical protein